MKTAYSESELQKLLEDVEIEIGSLVKSEKDKLAKAHPGEETSDEVPSDTSATAPASAAPPAESATPPAPVSASPADAAPPVDADGDNDGTPPVDGSAPDAAGDPAADQSADPAALQAEYAKLPPEDLKAHYLACKSALFAIMGAAAGPDAGAPPAPDAAPMAPPASPAASPSAPPAMKAEMGPGIPAPAPTGPVSPERPAPTIGKGEMAPRPSFPSEPSAPTIKKSEKDSKIDELTESLSKSEKGVQELLKIASMLIEAPKRKAVVSIAHVAKTEETAASDVSNLTKAEIKTRLRRAIETKLSKSDRDLVYGYDNGTVEVEKIAHLLKS